MALIDSASWANSGILVGTGPARVASRSPAAIRRVASTAATTGRVNRRASAAATMAAASRRRGADEAEVADPLTGLWIWRVTTSTGVPSVSACSGVGTAE